MNNQKKAALLLEIQKIGFVAIELNLYLDTHPRDENALRDYNNAATTLMRLINDYEKEYGPLVNFGWGGISPTPWRWIDEPWPWEL